MSESREGARELWRRIKDCYLEAVELPLHEREEYLAGQNDGDLRQEVESLLDSGGLEGFLEGAALTELGRAYIHDAGDSWVGKTLGAYRVDRLIAVGGMGRVYEATRADGQFQKKVAIKALQGASDSEHLLGRFQLERQALASLEHPNIARLLDAGKDENGTPYLVMELVDGEPINTYCDRLDLDVEQRLRLFLEVCSAVEFAHRHMIIHRDLKPRNILVNNQGHPRLLDFGIAGLRGEGRSADDGMTVSHALTPSYASPEQLHGAPVTASTDVFSLGVVLYELLAGSAPFNREGRSRHDLARSVCEEGPLPPSAAVVASASVSSPGARGGHRVFKRSRRLRGDLDQIVLTALQKDPALRYPSVQSLKEDIRRYLDRLPVWARKHTFAYRTGKLVQRNLAMTVAVIALAVSLVAGLVGSSLGLRATLRAKAESDAVTAYLQSVFAVANPFRAGREVTMIEQLVAATARIDRDLAVQPGVEASVRLIIGEAYARMWMWPESVPHFRRSLALLRDLRGPHDTKVSDALNLLGRSLAFLREPECVPVQQEALRIRRLRFGDEHAKVAESRASVGFALWQTQPDRIHEAIGMYRDALALYARLGLDRGADAARFTFGLAAMLAQIGDMEKSEHVFRDAVRIYEGLGEAPDRNRIECLNRFAWVLAARGKLDEAEAAARSSLLFTPTGHESDSPLSATEVLEVIQRARSNEKR